MKISLMIVFLSMMLMNSAVSVTSCQKIAGGGEYYLDSDIAAVPTPPNAALDCINITNGAQLVFDCQGHKISDSRYAFYIRDSQDVLIKNCVLVNNTYGVQTWYGQNITIANSEMLWDNGFNFGAGILFYYTPNSTAFANQITNYYQSIFLYASNYGSVTKNKVFHNWGAYAITTRETSYAKVTHNLVNVSGQYGIFLDGEDPDFNEATDNTVISSGEAGIRLRGTRYAMVRRNNVSDSQYGIWDRYAFNTEIEGNNVFNNQVGINIDQTSNSSVKKNNASFNSLYGIYVNTNGASFYGNVMNNTQSAFIRNGYQNYWDGNYFGSPDGSGYSDVCSDENADAVCDIPFTITVNNTDLHTQAKQQEMLFETLYETWMLRTKLTVMSQYTAISIAGYFWRAFHDKYEVNVFETKTPLTPNRIRTAFPVSSKVLVWQNGTVV